MTKSQGFSQRWLLVIALPVLAVSAQAAPVIGSALKAPLQQVLEQLDQNQPAVAVQALLRLLERDNLSRYEQATLKRFLAHAYLKGDQPELAIEAFEQALDSQVLTTKEQRDLNYQVGQLYLGQDRPRRAIEQLRDLDPAEYPQAALYLGRAQSRVGAHEEAIETAERRLTDGSQPTRDDINHLLALYRQAGRPEPAKALARQALAWYPAERLYWRELARLRLQLGETRAAAATLQAMERLGLLDTPRARDRLIELYRHLDAPTKAAELLEQTLDDAHRETKDATRERLAAAWLQARAWDKAAAELSALVADQARPDPELLADLAYCHYQQGQWTHTMDTYKACAAMLVRVGKMLKMRMSRDKDL
ncbi:putative PEP-CTERM system TPR-repeat lipoprotein [Thiorhodovibrio winogradskyi]|uniref:PEP-CTERM system TPR-repeat lipoprotein n=1 Tax=Thiorhodovibrio winogradskyi TaxID=77007 RepID=A0ABZ0S9X2_9GAMM|nr:tetratricopeptide repeat protein [Thiorhodovibrio winogradskyi]